MKIVIHLRDGCFIFPHLSVLMDCTNMQLLYSHPTTGTVNSDCYLYFMTTSNTFMLRKNRCVHVLFHANAINNYKNIKS
jgi:hypothetical protein